MAKPKGLGRGLDALLADNSQKADSLQNLAVDLLQAGKYQPRTRMDETSLHDLAESIKAQGIMQPILVRPLVAEGYEIIAGERRWRAARIAGLEQIPAIVREVPDESALALSLIENIQREDLNPLEAALGIQRLIEEFGMTHQIAGQALGYSRSTISNLLRLLNLAAPVQDLIMQGKIDMGHGRALLALEAGKQLEIAHLIMQRQLSVRETENLLKRISQASSARKQSFPDRDLLRLQEDMSARLGANVVIRQGKKGAGNVIIHYASLEQLDGILAKF
ncbi:ParB/RepB/Spo0J family partition protein [Nitrosomonas sp. HPC101]|uniref:ParB/RepB/Spo0J family partition protein n=1 Tax=Nitrosomonas sp. HPC101 TaxID=1658667 RepID=UPI00136F49EB|nr:ParB/RepB/Spo0J family partition protein [Nitrosomonas sp. HPC101]MXS86029.1 ParB/RepB/Spo0J family partition protein [Nitrosomonas sp. HPC101]